MNGAEKGFLLLTSRMGNPERRVLSAPQLRVLGQRMKNLSRTEEDRDLTAEDLISIGYGEEMARRILSLLDEEELLGYYLKRGSYGDCIPATRINRLYPERLYERLGLEAPGCLWMKGDPDILQRKAIALIGSRELHDSNREFAEEVGRQAARQGYALISGNARGADKAAQNACLRAGGSVIAVVADELIKHPPHDRILYLSEDSFDEGFSAQRALSRNRCIHTLGRMVFVAQSGMEKGGTWDGTAKNLRFGWSPVACLRDGSEASVELEQMGAYLIGVEDLEDFSGLPEQIALF